MWFHVDLLFRPTLNRPFLLELTIRIENLNPEIQSIGYIKISRLIEGQTDWFIKLASFFPLRAPSPDFLTLWIKFHNAVLSGICDKNKTVGIYRYSARSEKT